MRKTFDPQFTLGMHPIGKTVVSPRNRNALSKLSRALIEIYNNDMYRTKILTILANHINAGKKRTGRPGLNLWQIFVLGNFRLALDLSYDDLHDHANKHLTVRSLLGILAEGFSQPNIEISYQTVIDSVGLLSDDILMEINDVICEFGDKKIFKKKEGAGYIFKTDSYVVESNVHFPTDYNLLYDCMRKCIDMVDKIRECSPNVTGWRKSKSWRSEIKSLSRQVGQISGRGGQNKEERLKTVTGQYIVIANKLLNKLMILLAEQAKWISIETMVYKIQLIEYINLTTKHIDLIDRRLIKGEVIPHKEKMFSIFEQYTEWVNKGKRNVELGKKVCITTDENHMIRHWLIMKNETDSQIVPKLIKTLESKYKIISWSFDKGYYHIANKIELAKVVEKVIMPKKGKTNQKEKEEESKPSFVKLRRKHSAIESNINELEHRGLNRCPDRGEEHFDRYIALGICSYNLHKLGALIMKRELAELRKKEQGSRYKQAS